LSDCSNPGDLVSVIIPAYNAAAFIGEALDSALAQTYRTLEVIVIDDGSTDDTATIVQQFAARDSRVRLLQQVNLGVAAARNFGIEQSRGSLLAPLDADDIWHPDKIAKQVMAMHAGGPSVALVYAWSSLIDEGGNVLRRSENAAVHEGDVFPFLLLENFIGNGSAPLLRRHCVREVGGYDTTLRARGGECEDLMLYLRIAEKYRVRVVPEFLIGYRAGSSNLSNNVYRMKQGHELVLKEISSRHLDLPARLYRWSRSVNYLYLGRRSRRLGMPLSAAWFFCNAAVCDPGMLFQLQCLAAIVRLGKRFVGDQMPLDGCNIAPKVSRFLDLPSRPEVVPQMENFSRRRRDILASIAKEGAQGREIPGQQRRLAPSKISRSVVALPRIGVTAEGADRSL